MSEIKSINLKNFKYSWWKNTWDKIIQFKPIYILTDWFDRIVKIIQWVPVLWNDWDWEGTHILKILDYKLSRVQRVMNNDPYHIDEKTRKLSGPMYAKNIQEARNCIARILEDDYCKQEKKEHNKKFGKSRMLFTKEVGQYDKEGKPLTYKIKFTNDSAASRKDNLRIYILEEERKKQDMQKLFKILEENINCWWV